MNTKLISWVLRVAVFGEFLGHGVFALQGKGQWIGWIGKMLSVDPVSASRILTIVGLMDVVVAFIILIKPIRAVLLWAVVWGFWTALVRPLVGEPFWDFVERWANWGAPLALLLIFGTPNKLKEWLK